jgi:hypothetical protein
MQYFMARWFYIFILVILVEPIEYTNVYGITSQEADTGSFNIAQTTIITIITTVIALFLANISLDWYRHRQTRPILKINPNENPTTYENDVPMPMYNITTTTSGQLPQIAEMIGYKLNYKINRIKVRNSGNTAAEDCKGIIIQNNIEMKICWWVPSERHKMTINAKSYEYLDICSVLIGDRKKIIDNFSLDDFSRLIKSSRKIATVEGSQELDWIEYDIFKRFPNAEDAVNKLIPYVIAPTENNWQQSAFDNRNLKSGKASVRITSKNATPIEYNITILETPQDGRIIKVNDAVKI